MRRYYGSMPSDSESPDLAILDRLAAVDAAFRPSAPVNQQDMFRGRVDQLLAVQDVVGEIGRHGVIYGERGVGKTSLAAVSMSLLEPRAVAVRVNCEGTDTFQSVWEKVIEALRELRDTGFGLADVPEVAAAIERAASLLEDSEIGADRIRAALKILDRVVPVVIFIDEFDVLSAPSTGAMFADTIKTLSDQLVSSTLILVGVADDIDMLIEAHHSIERAMTQIHMPRMARADIEEVLTNGLAHSGLTIERNALDHLSLLPKGLPSYAHLLGKVAARRAIFGRQTTITMWDAEAAVGEAITTAHQSIQSAYHSATVSPRPKHFFREVLLACALVEGDQFGFFAPSEVQRPFDLITQKKNTIGTFNNHLLAFCEDDRGPILERRGEERRRRYRFVNPLMQPYVLMGGLASNLISVDDLTTLFSS